MRTYRSRISFLSAVDTKLDTLCTNVAETYTIMHWKYCFQYLLYESSEECFLLAKSYLRCWLVESFLLSTLIQSHAYKCHVNFLRSMNGGQKRSNHIKNVNREKEMLTLSTNCTMAKRQRIFCRILVSVYKYCHSERGFVM